MTQCQVIMARPIDHQKRRRIAAQALAVLTRQGVQETTMSDVATATGIKRPTLYYYFPDLSALYDTVLEDIEDRVLNHVVTAMGQEKHPVDQLAALLRAVVEFYQSEKDVLLGLCQLWATRSHDTQALQTRQQRVLEPQRRFLVQLVTEAVQKGRMRSCDVEGLVDTLLTVADGLVFRQATLGFDTEDVVTFMQKQVLQPLKIDAKE